MPAIEALPAELMLAIVDITVDAEPALGAVAACPTPPSSGFSGWKVPKELRLSPDLVLRRGAAGILTAAKRMLTRTTGAHEDPLDRGSSCTTNHEPQLRLATRK